MAANGTRTMAFQIPEDLFQRIKAHLERETARTGKKLTQREFVLGLIEEALEAAEDNELNAEILSELMDMEGARCELAVNGQEAKGLSILAS